MENNKRTSKILKIVAELLIFLGFGLIMAIIIIAILPFSIKISFLIPKFMTVSMILVAVGSIFLSVAQTKERANEIRNSTDVTSSNPETDFITMVRNKIKQQKQFDVQNHTCEYCGGGLKDTDVKCPNCGAPKKHK